VSPHPLGEEEGRVKTSVKFDHEGAGEPGGLGELGGRLFVKVDGEHKFEVKLEDRYM
jgi:hypothetical protein